MAVAFERTRPAPRARLTSAATTPARPSLRGIRDPRRPTRRLGSAGRVLVIAIICLLGWALLSAPDLLHNAQASPIGARRTVAIAVLRPFERLSEMLGLDRLTGSADRVLGHEPPVPVAPPIVVASPSIQPTNGQETPNSPPSSVSEPGTIPNYLYVPVLSPPTAGHPLSVLIIGDSIGIDMGEGLSRLLDAKGPFRPFLDGHESTGLARPDFFNWPNELARDLRQHHPDAVVAMMGANDAQNFLVGGRIVPFGSAAWSGIYRERVSALMTEVTESGHPMVWVGMPIMGSGNLSAAVRLIDSITLSEAVLHPGVTYVGSWSLFVDARGHYAAYLPDPSGRKELVRTPDGIHLTPAGGDRLALAVWQSLRTLWS